MSWSLGWSGCWSARSWLCSLIDGMTTWGAEPSAAHVLVCEAAAWSVDVVVGDGGVVVADGVGVDVQPVAAQFVADAVRGLFVGLIAAGRPDVGGDGDEQVDAVLDVQFV